MNIKPITVDQVVRNYYNTKQGSLQEALNHRAAVRAEAIDPTRMLSKEKNMRLLGSVPFDLLKAVEAIDPDTFRNKEKSLKFFRTFKQLAYVDENLL